MPLTKCKPSEVKALSFILACINNNAVFQSVSSDIVSIISNVTRLDVSYNESATTDYKLSSEDLEELCAVLTLFKQLKVLDVTNNNITDEAKKSLVEAMLQIDTLIDLQLSGNPISKSKLVFDTIIKLRKNQVQSIINSQKCSSHEEDHCVFYIMECLRSLESIKCCNIFVSVTTLDIDSLSDHGEKFFKYLDFLPTLKNLKINNVRSTTDSDMNLLREYLFQNITLSELDLSGCDLKKLEIDDRNMINNSLEVLKCNCCKITFRCLKSLMLLFRTVVHLEMDENDLHDEGISILHDVLLNNDQLMSSRSMTTLKLANNKITSSSSAAKIIEIVQKYEVKYLDISHNELSTFSCSEKHTITTLEVLHIAYNKLEPDKGFVHILQNCTKLEILHLENNRITSDIFKYLATGYLYTSKLALEALHLEKNPCMNEPKHVLVLKMIDKLHLKSNYGFFKCLPAEFSIFLFILELVHSVSDKTDHVPKIIFRIESINVSYSEYSSLCDQKKIANQKLQSHDLKQFCKYLKYLKSLECINMIDNDIKDDEDVMDTFAIAVLKNSCIIKVQLDGNPIYRSKKCVILFDTIEKMRTCTCRNSYVVEDNPEMLKGLIYILEYIDKFDDKKCDITETIEDLNISHIEAVDIKEIDNPEKMCEDLVRHIKLFCNLKTLNLSHGCVTSEAIQELSRFLKDNNTLSLLDLSYNHIQADGALDILTSLETSTCTALKVLNLSNNKIAGEKKCREIAIKIHNLRKDYKMDIDVKK